MLSAEETSPVASGEVGVAFAAAPQWVVFVCDGHAFGLPLGRARAILPPLEFTRAPGCGPEVCGLASFRGRIITAFDLGAALGLRASVGVEDHRLLLLRHGTRLALLAVDGVLGMAPGGLSALAPAAQALPAGRLDPEDLLGSGWFGDRVFTAIDPDRILDRLFS